jgi:hypothetical protein
VPVQPISTKATPITNASNSSGKTKSRIAVVKPRIAKKIVQIRVIRGQKNKFVAKKTAPKTYVIGAKNIFKFLTLKPILDRKIDK